MRMKNKKTVEMEDWIDGRLDTYLPANQTLTLKRRNVMAGFIFPLFHQSIFPKYHDLARLASPRPENMEFYS
jgi:hypothetical protein